MDFNDEEQKPATEEIGSDELLSDDKLHLPESANPLVRLHAVRAWLSRRQKEANIEMGTAALHLQDIQVSLGDRHLRRREYEDYQHQAQQAQLLFQQNQERLGIYEETASLLEDCVDHTTVGERLLVEYYLQLENLVQNELQEHQQEATLRAQVLTEVQQRVERVGSTYEDD